MRRILETVVLLLAMFVLSGVSVAQSGGWAAYSTTGDTQYTTFTYSVDGAPPNTCGEFRTLRSEGWVIAPGWICTDSTGHATKGPWSCSQDQTDQYSHINWPNGTRTNDSEHSCYVTQPYLAIDPSVLPSLEGDAASAQSSGFLFGTPWQTSQISVAYRLHRYYLPPSYWNGTCFCSDDPVWFGGDTSPSAGFRTRWSFADSPCLLTSCSENGTIVAHIHLYDGGMQSDTALGYGAYAARAPSPSDRPRLMTPPQTPGGALPPLPLAVER